MPCRYGTLFDRIVAPQRGRGGLPGAFQLETEEPADGRQCSRGTNLLRLREIQASTWFGYDNIALKLLLDLNSFAVDLLEAIATALFKPLPIFSNLGNDRVLPHC